MVTKLASVSLSDDPNFRDNLCYAGWDGNFDQLSRSTNIHFRTQSDRTFTGEWRNWSSPRPDPSWDRLEGFTATVDEDGRIDVRLDDQVSRLTGFVTVFGFTSGRMVLNDVAGTFDGRTFTMWCHDPY